MSVSLVVIRLETAEDSPTLKHIEYRGKEFISRHLWCFENCAILVVPDWPDVEKLVP